MKLALTTMLAAGVFVASAVANPSVAPKGTLWSTAQVWLALESIPSIHVVSTDGSFDFHVLGPATKAGDAFQPKKISPLVPIGAATVVGGRKEWSAFSVSVRASVNGVEDEQTLFFCLRPLSPVRTTFPYSRFRLSSVDSEFVIGRNSCIG